MIVRSFWILVVLVCTLLIPITAQTPRYARVISDAANLRDTPSVASATEQQIEEGTIVKVLDEKLPWYVVRAGNRVGWMHGNTLEFIVSNASLPTTVHETVIPTDKTVLPAIPGRKSSSEMTTEPARPSREDSSPGYIRGPRGGCYYISGSGRKVYVDRSMCN
jgi:SH3-like domain-containing protein